MLFLKWDSDTCLTRNYVQSEERQPQKYLKGNENINGKGLTFLVSYLIPKIVNETNSHWFTDLLSVSEYQGLETAIQK